MKKMKLIKLKIFLGIFLISILSFAQKIEEEYQEVRDKYNSKEFQYIIEEEKSVNTNWLDKFLVSLFTFLAKINWSIVLYCIFGIVFLIILYKLYKNGFIFNFKPNKKLNDDDSEFDFIEKNLLDVDLIELINNAKANKDYRLAIRYYHYLNAQNLAKKNHFNWDPKKTNQQLITEIKKTEIKELFHNNTQIFNQIWFGNFTLNEEDFLKYEANYKFLNESI